MNIKALGTLIYCAVKAGVDSIAKTLAKELGAKKIRVNTNCTGYDRI